MISASEVIDSIKNATEKAKIIQTRQETIGGLVTVDMSGVLEIIANGVFQVLSDFISQQILNPHFSYTQEDGTIAIPYFKIIDLQKMTRYSYKEMPEEVQLMFVGYAKNMLKLLLEEVIENVGIQQ